MMGTDKSLDTATNVEIITYMEQQILQLGKTKGFEGIFTTNTNPLTQVRKDYMHTRRQTFPKLILFCVYIFFSNSVLMCLVTEYLTITRSITT